MTDILDPNESKMIFKLIDELEYEELLQLISESKVFKEKGRILPRASVLAHLYVFDRLRFLTDEIGTGSQDDLRGEIDEYIDYVYKKAVVDLIVFQQILDNFNTTFALLEARVTFKSKTKDTLIDLFENVIDNYWRYRLRGEYDAAKDMALLLTSLMAAEPQKQLYQIIQRVLEAHATDYQKSHPKTTVKTIPVKKAEEITLLLDYSFDNNKYNASYKLSNTEGQSVRVHKLFQPGTLEFLIENVINPLTIKNTIINQGNTITMSDTAYKAWGDKHSNHIYRLNQAIRKHLDNAGGKKIQSFSQQGKDITVYIKIQITSLTKNEKFGKESNRSH